MLFSILIMYRRCSCSRIRKVFEFSDFLTRDFRFQDFRFPFFHNSCFNFRKYLYSARSVLSEPLFYFILKEPRIELLSENLQLRDGKEKNEKMFERSEVSKIRKESQNDKSSEFLDRNSFQKEVLVDGTGFEPAASAMPTLRSFQADLPAHNILNLTGKLLSIMGKKTIPHFCLSPV